MPLGLCLPEKIHDLKILTSQNKSNTGGRFCTGKHKMSLTMSYGNDFTAVICLRDKSLNWVPRGIHSIPYWAAVDSTYSIHFLQSRLTATPFLF